MTVIVVRIDFCVLNLI